MERVLKCFQSTWPWHPFVCSVAPVGDHLPLMLSCWCSIDLVMIFFVSPLYTDPHEHFNSYTPEQLFGIKLSLLLHKMWFKLGPVGNATQNPNISISLLIFGPNFGIQESLFFVSVAVINIILGATCFLFKAVNQLL